MDIFAFVMVALFVVFFMITIKSAIEKSKYFGLLTFITALAAGVIFMLLYYFIEG